MITNQTSSVNVCYICNTWLESDADAGRLGADLYPTTHSDYPGPKPSNMFLNEVGKRMTAPPDQTSQDRHKRRGKKKKHGTDNSNVLENPPPPQLRTHRPSRQLEFNQAMEDFANMFPGLDRDVIESVLRSNNGAVDVTIDQLLVLDQGADSQEDLTPGTPDSNQMFPHHQMSLFGPDKPPPYSPPSPNSPYSKFNAEPSNQEPVLPQRNTPVSGPSVLCEVQDPFSLSAYPPPLPPRPKQYKPALLGPLPDDFLRLPVRATPPPAPSHQQAAAASSGDPHQTSDTRVQSSIRRNDRKGSSRSEDQKVALLLQSDVFLEELLADTYFMASLDRDYAVATQDMASSDSQGTGAVGGAHGVNIRDKLPYMSKSTKAKLSSIAKKYNKKRKKLAKLNSSSSINPPAQSVPPPDAFGPPRRLNDRTKRQAEANHYASFGEL